MKQRLSDLVLAAAENNPEDPALSYKEQSLRYGELADLVTSGSRGLLEATLRRGDRVAVYLEKRLETVVALFGTSAAGGVFVPVNPLLKARQVSHILRDCEVKFLVTSRSRLELLRPILQDCPKLAVVIVVDLDEKANALQCPAHISIDGWNDLIGSGEASSRAPHPALETDMASILYTSGSTGNPKGVVLSHKNMLSGAISVSEYLENRAEDRILAVLPLSFDAGLSQLTTAFNVGAKAVLMNYLLPGDVVRTCASERITGLTCVPPLWIQLSEQDWPAAATENFRYFANTGGRMPRTTLTKLRSTLPSAKPYLMYGLTEAFRSTFLDPSQVDQRPDSIGKAVPGAEVLVVRQDGAPCAVGEVGELVHRGPFVAMGYWNDPERTAERFRPAPGQPDELSIPETSVWSGDYVRADDEGYLYFVGRRDEMIKTSGYRVSPTELEELFYSTGLVGEVVALGIADPLLGQAIVVVATPPGEGALDSDRLMAECRSKLPNYMMPSQLIERERFPRNANGKIDRKMLASEVNDMIGGQPSQTSKANVK